MNNHLFRLAVISLALSACSLNEEQKPPAGAPSGATKTAEVGTRSREEKVAAEAAPAAALGRVPLSVATVHDRSGFAPAPPCCFPAYSAQDRENYEHFDENPVKLVHEQPVSTFSIDVDTGSYANVRRFLNAGTLPPEDAVRVEELLNYFGYEYPAPAGRERPFSVTTSLAPAPWNADKLLLQVGLKGYEIPAERRAAANLVFLIDVSGSMQDPDKLPLLKNAFRLLTRQMKASDRVALVVYAGAAGAVLDPRRATSRRRSVPPWSGLRPVAAPTAPAASGWPTILPGRASSRAGSTASCWRPTVTSTWAPRTSMP